MTELTSGAAERPVKRHFRGLDELRAIAALAVIVHHLELYKARDGISTLYSTGFRFLVSSAGENGVGLFFVLSGFLITYLLLTEKQALGTIRYRKFMWRRTLRIWPLYYLTVAMGFFVVPWLFELWTPMQAEAHYAGRIRAINTDLNGSLGLFLIFAPNFSLALYPAVVGAAHAWSIGVEEQFYVVWPLVVRFVRRRLLPVVFIGVIIVKLVLVHEFLPSWVAGTQWRWILKAAAFLRFEFMALGALGAYVQYFHEDRLKRVLASPVLMLGHLVALGMMLSIPVPGGEFLIGVLFLLLILYQTNETPLTVSVPRVAKLGRISYGLYMIHPIAMYFSFATLHSVLDLHGGWLYHTLLYVSVIGLTIGLSSLSYRFLEKPFLKLKDSRFATLKSSES